MAILRNKNITFSLILMCLIVVSPIANAQLGGLGGLGGLLGGLLGSITSIFNIQGLLRCSVTGTVSTNNVTSVPPPFPNAGIVLQCAGQNVSSTTTNANGVFSLPTMGTIFSPSTLLNSGCRIIVTTPLTSCNASLPAGGLLMAPLALLGATSSNGLSILDLVPGLFSVVPNPFGLVG
ncbi:phylloplanin-like [Raphanus sativus]|uniref:Phylloplanin-like n=1 Tax=Raphanus sativus TaxID=3726 RepID=A0A9W3BZ42_RAPSA|nr:phylloplanin-like [Raphanus sativus]XP_056844623.1 phylloplanin-like [Raphanus sativus]